MPLPRFVTLLLILLPLLQSARADNCQWHSNTPDASGFEFDSPSSYPPAVQLNGQTTIGQIQFRRHNVFDLSNPKEDNWLFSLANRLHFVTDEQVLRRQLLFDSGAAYNRQQLIESERILRNSRYLYDARVVPLRLCDNRLDLQIVTREIWSLFPEISFTRSGGQSNTRLRLRDTNLLGWGKHLAIGYNNDRDRSGPELFYNDPALFGSRWQLQLDYADNDDGQRYFARLRRPFYSLEGKQQYLFQVARDDRIDNLYFRDKETNEFRRLVHQYDASTGWSAGLNMGAARRWLLGFRYEQQEFFALPTTDPTQGLAEDRTISAPWIGLHYLEDHFITLDNLDTIARTEDIHLGWDLFASLGFSSKALDAHRDQLMLRGRLTKAFHRPGQLLRLRLDLDGFYDVSDNRSENLDTSLGISYFARQGEKTAWFSRLALDYWRGTTIDRQLLLGGDTGLRGYPNRYQVGDRRWLWTIEQRYYSDWQPFRLVHIGASAFVDIGRAWFPGRNNGDNGGTLSNVGLGLRFVPTRAAADKVVHLDFAWPLNKADDTDSMQLVISIKNSF